MSKHTGPYTVHVKWTDHPRTGPRPVAKMVYKTFKAAENNLLAFQVNVVAKWITNAQGVVHSPYSKGDPCES